MKNKVLWFAALLFIQCSLSYGQDQTVNGRLDIKPTGWGNTHIPYNTGDIYLTGYSGSESGSLIFRTFDGSSYSEKFKITPDGKVGIGISAPTEMLHVAGGAMVRKSLFSAVTGSSDNSWVRDSWLTSNVGIRWNEESNLWIRGNYTYNDFGGIVWQDEGTYFIRVRSGTKLEYTNQEFLNSAFLFADINNGNVGIGTTDPGSSKLAVNGTIRAKEVKVETGWSDFVFEEGYPLKSLTEVETFIKENGHLPDIPSAKEVEENGVNVGEMEARLLQKVEELTLYLIKLEKEIAGLKKDQR